MYTNLIQNPGFESTSDWNTLCSASTNTYEYTSNDYYSGSQCMKLSSSENSGWSAIYQTVHLTAGKTYTLSFYAKRTTTDIWVATQVGGVYQHSPSLMNDVGSEYSLVSQSISVSGSGVIPVSIYIITGSIAGSAWIDDVELLEETNDPVSSTESDAVSNGDFENGTTDWQLDTTVSYDTDSYEGTGCLYYLGGSSQAARQWMTLVPGGNYTLTYYAKRIGGLGIQASIQYTQEDGTTGYIYHTPLYDQVSSVYGQQVYQFTLPATAQSGYIRLAMNTYDGQGSGSLWLDNVELHGPTPICAEGNLIRITNIADNATVYVRPEPDSSVSYIGQLCKHTLAVCICSVEANGKSWGKLLWGGQDYEYAYIDADFIEDTNDAPSNAMDAAIQIGQSMALGSYTNPADIDIHATDWCVLYVTFLMKAGGVSVNNYPDYVRDSSSLIAKVSDARQYFNTYREYPGCADPEIGDWIFYKNAGGNDQHVGLITACDSTTHTLSTVEGNMGNTIQTYENQDYTGTIHSMTVQGFATPTWA